MDRIAIISDVHANITALNAVLEEFAPIKAFTGNETPETALDLYKKYHHME